nr:ester cyclase [uncultured Rhodoferax sp.]
MTSFKLSRLGRLVLLPALFLTAQAYAVEAPLKVVQKYMAAWNAHNANDAALNFDYDVEYFDASVGQSQYGVVTARDNVIKFFMDAFPDLQWKMEGAPVVSKDAVAFQWVFTGTNTGIAVDCGKATGKPIAFHGVSMIRFKAGKIAYQGDYYDALTFRNQVGLPAVCPVAAPAVPAPQ